LSKDHRLVPRMLASAFLFLLIVLSIKYPIVSSQYTNMVINTIISKILYIMRAFYLKISHPETLACVINNTMEYGTNMSKISLQ